MGLMLRLKGGIRSLLGEWLYVFIIAASCFVFGGGFGSKAYIGYRQGVGLRGVVSWFGRGNGNLMQYDEVTLIVLSLLWLTLGVVVLVAGWDFHRRSPRRKT